MRSTENVVAQQEHTSRTKWQKCLLSRRRPHHYISSIDGESVEPRTHDVILGRRRGPRGAGNGNGLIFLPFPHSERVSRNKRMSRLQVGFRHVNA